MPAMAPIGTVSLAATIASSRVLLTQNSARVIVTAPVGNADIAFVTFGGAAVAATSTNGCPILPGTAQTFSLGDATHAAAICPSSTATLYFTVGIGE